LGAGSRVQYPARQAGRLGRHGWTAAVPPSPGVASVLTMSGSETGIGCCPIPSSCADGRREKRCGGSRATTAWPTRPWGAGSRGRRLPDSCMSCGVACRLPLEKLKSAFRRRTLNRPRRRDWVGQMASRSSRYVERADVIFARARVLQIRLRAQLSPFGGIATIVSASDYVSTSLRRRVEPDLIASWHAGGNNDRGQRKRGLTERPGERRHPVPFSGSSATQTIAPLLPARATTFEAYGVGSSGY